MSNDWGSTMNERIQELMEQASSNACYDEPDQLHLMNNEIEKFAELIVRAVFDKIEEERFEVYQPVKESVMKHFGVSE